MLGATARVAVTGHSPPWERAAFHRLNRLPDHLFAPAFGVHLSGIAGAAPVLAGLAWWRGERHLAAAALAAYAGKQVVEKAVKHVVHRQRPGTVHDDGIVTRGQVHLEGKSFPSGHASLAFALAGVWSPYLRGAWRALPWALATGTALARVYVGAHHPLDVVAGAGAGLMVSGTTNLVLGVPGRRG